MAESDDDLDLRPADAGFLFRAEMWATNAVLGYWKHALTVAGVFLLSLLAYGQFGSWEQTSQRRASASIALVESEMSASLIELSQRAAMGVAHVDKESTSQAADKLLAIASGISGTAQVEALLKAAELYRLAGATDKQREALERATETSTGILGYSAQGALADLELEADDKAALERLKALQVEHGGFLAEQALLDLARAYEHFEMATEAREIYEQFVAKWPESVRLEVAEQALEGLSGATP